MNGLGRHHLNALARRERTINHSHVGDHATVGVVNRVKDHGSGWRVWVSDRIRHGGNDFVEQCIHADTGLTRHAQAVFWVTAD